MPRLSVKKILALSLVALYGLTVTGCDLLRVDKNKNSYLTTPYDVIEVESAEDGE